MIKNYFKIKFGTSMVVQWLRLCFHCRGHGFDLWSEFKIPHATLNKIKINGWILFCPEAHLSNLWPITGQLLITEIISSFFYCDEVVCALELTCSSMPIWALELAHAVSLNTFLVVELLGQNHTYFHFESSFFFFFKL